MIDLYYWTTPNGQKITMFLEEAGLPCRILPVNIGRGEQFAPEFLRIAPNNRIPAIVDHAPADGGDPLSIFESGAILQYLADKTGQFIPQDLRGRNLALQWLYWQMGGLGPMAGQTHHFTQTAPEPVPYAIGRYVKETARLLRQCTASIYWRTDGAGSWAVRTRLRPSALARSIAVLAACSSVAGVASAPDSWAKPMLALIRTSRPSMLCNSAAASLARKRSAASTAVGSAVSGMTRENSAPP